MSDPYVTVEKKGLIATVTFDRGANLNAFDQQLVEELTEVARSFHDDVETRAVILTGNKNYFSAGADLGSGGEREGMSEVEKRRSYFRGVRLCEAWEAMPQITIAAMEKLAVGAGIALPLACDWRVLGESCYLYVPEVKIGLNLQWGALPRLINLVGPARAKRICILCEKMDAATALDWGLCDEVAPDGKTVARALEMAETVCEMPQIATQMVKEAVNATATALNRASSFADADQSWLTATTEDALSAKERFGAK